MVASVAAYHLLHALPAAERLLRQTSLELLAGLLRRQVSEPQEEIEDRKSIPVLTAISDAVSLEVMQQYHENPYPRWIINRRPLFAGDRDMQDSFAGETGQTPQQILIA